MSKIDYQALREAAESASKINWTGLEDDLNADGYMRTLTRYIQCHSPNITLSLLDERDALNKRIAELEKSEEQLINERDHAESALADMYFAATGDRPEWSNWFGFSDAVDAVVDRIADLEAKQPSPVVPEEMYWQDAPVEGSSKAAAYATGWNACRATMLKGDK